jgi:uncharacterized protein (TIGR03067 family)
MRGLAVGRALILLLGVCCLSRAEAAGDAATRADLKRLQGRWKPVLLERAGETVADSSLPGARFEVKGDALLFKAGDKTLLDVRVRLNPTKKPAEIDLVPVGGKGKPVLAIYRLEGKWLTLCWPLGEDQRRPEAFGEKGRDVATLTLERLAEETRLREESPRPRSEEGRGSAPSTNRFSPFIGPPCTATPGKTGTTAPSL